MGLPFFDKFGVEFKNMVKTAPLALTPNEIEKVLTSVKKNFPAGFLPAC